MQTIDDKQHTDHIDTIDGKRNSLEDEGVAAYVPDSPEEKRLVRKIDKHLLPMLWIMYIMNYIDRTNIGNAKTGGMEKDWNLSSSEYSIILSIFFVSYLLFEVPSNMILVRTRPSIFLPAIMAAWGALSVGVYGIHNFGGMVAFRFALGIIEAGFFPGVMLLMSCWYKPAELSKRVAFFYTASLVAGAFGGLLAGGLITGMEGVGGVRGWKWLFIIEGVATVVLSLGAFFILPDYPTTTKWLTPEEKELAVSRLMSRGEEAEEGDDMTHREALWAACKDVKIWTFMLAYNVLNSVGTISYFFPTLMESLGYTGRMSQFMTVPIYVVALIIAIFMGWNADRTGRKAFHIMAACTWGVLSFILVAAIPVSQVKYTFLCFGGAAVWSSVPLFLSWMITMFEGKEKRAVCIAIINGVGNLASIYGSFFWPSNTKPKYIMGFSITTAFMGLCLAVTVFNYWKFGDKGWRHEKAQRLARQQGR